MRAWCVHRFGDPTEVLVLENDLPEPVAAAGELLIDVEAVTLNFNDIDGIRGRYRTVPMQPPYVPGMEVLGHVRDVGPGVDREWIGTRVAACPRGAHGGYAAVAVAPLTMTFAMPDHLPSAEAAAVFMPFHLAWLALYERAGLRTGETLLVHAGAGGAGSAAVQLGAVAGARVLATAGSPEKLQLCRELGADAVIDYRAADFVAAVLDATGGRGVDVVFDSVGGEVTTRTFSCMAYGGRHLMVGFASGIEAEDEGFAPRPVLFGNFSLVGVCLAYVEDPLNAKKERGVNFLSRKDGARIHEQLLALLDAGSLRPVVGGVVAFEELPHALAAMERRETTGRIVALTHG